MREIQLAKLKSWEVKEYVDKGAVIVIPCGSIEQHGPHLPLDVDSFLVSETAKEAVRAVSAEFPVLIAPPLMFGCSGHHLGFPGTLTLNQETFIHVVKEICASLIKHGFKKILLLNGHSGNTGALSVAANDVKLNHPEHLIVFFNYWALAGEVLAKVRESQPGGIAHGCEFETSLYLARDSEHVDMAKAVREIPAPRLKDERIDLINWGKINVAFTMPELTKSGVLGDPHLASAEKGREIFSVIVAKIACVLREMAAFN